MIATVEISFLQNSRSKFSFAACALESGNPTPVSKKLAFGYISEKNSIKGMLPPHPIKSGRFPLKTYLLASKNAVLTSGSNSLVSNPLPPLLFNISTLAPYVSFS